MAYDGNRPADDEYISAGPGVIRTNMEAVKNGKIVDAGFLDGKSAGNASGNIPINNGIKCVNLDADKLDGHDSEDFAAAVHNHNVATTNADGFMSNTDKQKLDGIAAGASTNSPAIYGINATNGSSGVAVFAKSSGFIIDFVKGSNIEITADDTNGRLTFSVTGTVPNATNAASASNAGTLQGYGPSSFAAAGHTTHTGEANSKADGPGGGYFKMANGIIVQFGRANVPGGSTYAFTFPVTFPTLVAVVTTGSIYNGNTGSFPGEVYLRTTSAVTLFNCTTAARELFYIAIGW